MRRFWFQAALALGAAAACNGEFHFDDPGTSTAGTVAATGGTGAVANGVAGYDEDEEAAGGVRDANGCAYCGDFGLKCATEWMSCVECIDDDDCTTADLPYCDPQLHRCSPCNTSSGCDPGYTCDGWSHACMRTCATESDPDPDCDGGPRMCNQKRNECVACLSNDDCHDPTLPYCAPGGVRCAECAADGDCSLGLRCDQLSFSCVVCRDSLDCAVGAICDPSAHTCVDVSSAER